MELPSEIQEKIDDLIEEAWKRFNSKEYAKSFDIAKEAWITIPEPRESYFESYNVAEGLFNDYLNLKEFEQSEKWLNEAKKVNQNLNKWNDGQVNFLEGRYFFEKKDYKTALKHLNLAFEKSEGRCFEDEDPKYINFVQNPEKYTSK